MNNLPLNLQDLVRPNILNLIPYSSARTEYSDEASIFLDANENPNNTGYNRYPDPLQRKLKNEISKLKGVSPDNIFVGNGSDEAIDLLIRIFCMPRVDEIMLVEPTYGMYMVSANINNIDIRRTTLNNDFTLNAEKVLEEVKSTTKLLFLCSPNNPSGNTLEPSEVKKILDQFHGIVVIDEAYIDFSSHESWIKEINSYSKLVILHTLSKAWGMAGLRVGMAFSNSVVIDLLNKIKPPYNLSSLVQEKACEVIQNNKSEVDLWIKEIITEREWLKDELGNFEFVETIYPSDANFLLVKVTDPYGLYDYLVESGIIVRNRDRLLLCEGCLRITVGTKDENRELVTAMKSYKKS